MCYFYEEILSCWPGELACTYPQHFLLYYTQVIMQHATNFEFFCDALNEGVYLGTMECKISTYFETIRANTQNMFTTSILFLYSIFSQGKMG